MTGNGWKSNVKDETMEALEPCPCCGELPKWRGTRSDYARGIFRLQCLGETHLVQSYGPTEAAAIAAWNTRPSPSATAAVEEVTQEDREAAASLAGKFQKETYIWNEVPAIRRGEHDDWALTQAFRDHRLAALRSTQPASPAAVGEVERLVQIFRVLPLEGDAGCDKLTDAEWRKVARAALSSIPTAKDELSPNLTHLAILPDPEPDPWTVERIVGWLKAPQTLDRAARHVSEVVPLLLAELIDAGEPFKEAHDEHG